MAEKSYRATHWPKFRVKPQYWTIIRIPNKPRDVYGWADIKATLQNNDVLLIQEGRILAQPYFTDAITDPDVKAISRPAYGITGLRVKGPGRAHCIIQSNVWQVADNGGTRDCTDAEILQAWEHARIGSYSTPAALGEGILRNAYPPKTCPIFRPQWWAWQRFHDELVGGRVDTHAGPSTTYDTLYESDMTSAYVHFLSPLPTGPMLVYGVVKVDGEPYNWSHVKQGQLGAASFRRYRVNTGDTYPNITLGPLPVRAPNGAVEYPTCGAWEGWYWYEEVEAARALGWECRAMEGFYWDELTNVLDAGRQRLWELRQTAPSPAIKSLMKSAAVAGIGMFARDACVSHIEPDTGRGDSYIDFNLGYIKGMAQVTERIDREGLLVQLASYIYMRCRMALYYKALPYAERGTLVATNFDAIYTTEPIEPDRPEELGGWKVKTLHEARIPNPRQLESQEKTRLPGVKR